MNVRQSSGEMEQAHIKHKNSPLLLTGVQRVADVGIAAHVLVQGLDSDDLGAHGGHVRDAGLVAGAEESWRVVVTVLHVDHHLCKVPFHWYLLVTHLMKRRSNNR